MSATLSNSGALSAALSYELRPGWEVFGYAQPGIAAYAGMRLTLGGEAGGLKL
ncbi:MAG: hypothetical protein J0I57_07320 [Hyphomicrobium sp.]|nr:hypothetical protein [Hyphomicrobium sp.]